MYIYLVFKSPIRLLAVRNEQWGKKKTSVCPAWRKIGLHCKKKKYFQDLLSQRFFFCQINLIYLVQITYYFEFLLHCINSIFSISINLKL